MVSWVACPRIALLGQAVYESQKSVSFMRRRPTKAQRHVPSDLRRRIGATIARIDSGSMNCHCRIQVGRSDLASCSPVSTTKRRSPQ